MRHQLIAAASLMGAAAGSDVALRTRHRSRGMTPAWAKLAGVIMAAAGLLAVGGPAVAAITLTYTGKPFDSNGSTAAGSGITGYVVLTDFDISVGQQLIAPNLLDWSISNGSYTLRQAAGNALTRFNMEVAAGGEVKTWSFDAQDTGDNTWTKFSRTDSAFLDISVIKDNSYSGESENVGPSGSWTVANAVPEPATWVMMLLGFGLIGGVMRRNRDGIGVA
jgi:hypothetical protein